MRHCLVGGQFSLIFSKIKELSPSHILGFFIIRGISPVEYRLLLPVNCPARILSVKKMQVCRFTWPKKIRIQVPTCFFLRTGQFTGNKMQIPVQSYPVIFQIWWKKSQKLIFPFFNLNFFLNFFIFFFFLLIWKIRWGGLTQKKRIRMFRYRILRILTPPLPKNFTKSSKRGKTT